MGGGKSSGSQTTTVQMTPEQQRALKIQTDALESTFLPAYTNTVGKAEQAYNLAVPASTRAAQTALDVAQRAGAQQEVAGGTALGFGLKGLASLYDPNYKAQQIQAAMQPAREEIREQVGSQNALFGGAGGAGGSRYALARENTRQLGEQRLGSVAAQASAGVEQNRALAAQQLAGFGMQGLTGAQQSAAARIGYAQNPQDLVSKYASVIYGVPQASTTPNFQGTQGGTSSGSSKGFGFTKS
jgi:hypothetical protein